MIDSHAHFDTFEEAGSVQDVLDRASEAGVSACVAIGGSPKANTLTVSLSERFPKQIVGTVGYDRDLASKPPPTADLDPYLQRDAIVGIGETGLDYHYEPELAGEQKALFESMLEKAIEFSKPVIIHSRDADEDMLAMLRQYVHDWKGDASRPGVLHCFTGSWTFARKLLDLGIMISFSGIVTFRNADALREVAANVPLDRVLIETDSPYLAPVPHRGQPNEPAYVAQVAETLASLHNVDVQRIADQTTENTRHLFQMNGSSS